MSVYPVLMHRCLALARRGAGQVSPNPLVGCVLADDNGHVLGEGWHARYGGAHAEPAAIADAVARHGEQVLKKATLYVNLEPCAHWGKTPPCADLIIEKGIRRVVVGMTDPFPRVDGKGIEKLQQAGVEVVVDVEAQACRRLNEAFVHHVQTERPLVSLKVAQTLDGFVATRTGDSRWVTAETARARVHAWRATADAVLIGSGTALADNPALTVRHTTELEAPISVRQPLRVVLDRAGALPPTLGLFTDSYARRTVAIVAPGAEPLYGTALRAQGGTVLTIPLAGNHLDLSALLVALGGGKGGIVVQSLLVEAGPGLASALLEADLVDRYHCFIAPKVLGDGLPALRLPGPATMAETRTWAAHTWETVGDDMLFTGYRHAL